MKRNQNYSELVAQAEKAVAAVKDQTLNGSLFKKSLMIFLGTADQPGVSRFSSVARASCASFVRLTYLISPAGGKMTDEREQLLVTAHEIGRHHDDSGGREPVALAERLYPTDQELQDAVVAGYGGEAKRIVRRSTRRLSRRGKADRRGKTKYLTSNQDDGLSSSVGDAETGGTEEQRITDDLPVIATRARGRRVNRMTACHFPRPTGDGGSKGGKPPSGNGSPTMCGKSRSFIRAVISPLRVIKKVPPAHQRSSPRQIK